MWQHYTNKLSLLSEKEGRVNNLLHLWSEIHSILTPVEWKFTTQRVESRPAHSIFRSDHWRHHPGSEKRVKIHSIFREYCGILKGAISADPYHSFLASNYISRTRTAADRQRMIVFPWTVNPAMRKRIPQNVSRSLRILQDAACQIQAVRVWHPSWKDGGELSPFYTRKFIPARRNNQCPSAYSNYTNEQSDIVV